MPLSLSSSSLITNYRRPEKSDCELDVVLKVVFVSVDEVCRLFSATRLELSPGQQPPSLSNYPLYSFFWGLIFFIKRCKGVGRHHVRRLDADGGLAENGLSENGEDTAAGTLATCGADGPEVGGRGWDGTHGAAVEVSDAENVGGAALGRVEEARARVVGAATTAVATTAVAAATVTATAVAASRRVGGSGRRVRVGGEGQSRAGHEEEGSEGERGLHVD